MSMPTVTIGLDDDQRHGTTQLLYRVLADEFLLYVKTLGAHGNITGNGFLSWHLMLEEQYLTLLNQVDTVAERVRALDGRPLGSMAGFHNHTRLKEWDEHNSMGAGLEIV